MDLTILTRLEKLNQLSLTDDEREELISFFDKAEADFSKLNEVNTENTERMVHVMPMTNVLREDVRKQPFTRESLLEGAPQRSEDSWQVPRLVK